MNQADVTKLVSKLNINVLNKHRRLRNPEGPKGRVLKIQKSVTALFKHERIELNRNRADESRGYAERLISEAIRHGDQHHATMELANFWLLEKQLIHKLFKVLVPRFQNYNTAVTRCLPLQRTYPAKGWDQFEKSLLELKGNPYPPLIPNDNQNRNLLHNVLLEEARKEMRQTQYLEAAFDKANVEKQASTWAAKPAAPSTPETAAEESSSDVQEKK